MLSVRAYGDSLVLPRIGVVTDEQRYLTQLRRWWLSQPEIDDVSLVDRSRRAETVESLRQWWIQDNSYYGEEGDVLIVHCGIVDCVPRPLKLSERDRIDRLPERPRKAVRGWVHRRRPWLVEKRNVRYVPPKRFVHRYKDWLTRAAEVHERIYVVNIAPAGNFLEQRSPGAAESVRMYNGLINDAIDAVGSERIHLIDVAKMIGGSKEGIDDFVVADDGHHITQTTHNFIFESIRDLEIRAQG